jgi:hypothetical protein
MDVFGHVLSLANVAPFGSPPLFPYAFSVVTEPPVNLGRGKPFAQLYGTRECLPGSPARRPIRGKSEAKSGLSGLPAAN